MSRAAYGAILKSSTFVITSIVGFIVKIARKARLN